jgi:hypothetical protein
MMLTRKQFRQHWNKVRPGLGDEDSALWIPEIHHDKKCRWFVSTKPIHAWDEFIQEGHPENRKQHYWAWYHQHCRGQVMCYSSSETEEWWGFSHRADVAWWLLKWAK